jgi:molybdate transport system ATP-binding protein
MLATSRPADLSALNVAEGLVTGILADDGPIAEVRLDCSGDTLIARVTRLSVDRLGIKLGTPVFALVKTVAIDRKSVSGPFERTFDV